MDDLKRRINSRRSERFNVVAGEPEIDTSLMTPEGRRIWENAPRGVIPDSKWISVQERLPVCDLEPNTFGVPVIIYPPFKDRGFSDMHQAYYGTRVTDEPSFYLYGKVIDVTHWMPIPEAPVKEGK